MDRIPNLVIILSAKAPFTNIDISLNPNMDK